MSAVLQVLSRAASEAALTWALVRPHAAAAAALVALAAVLGAGLALAHGVMDTGYKFGVRWADVSVELVPPQVIPERAPPPPPRGAQAPAPAVASHHSPGRP